MFQQQLVRGAGDLETGRCTLYDADLGTLDLVTNGWVVNSLQIGSPAERLNVRDRSQNDGTIDDTRFVGGRVVTLTVRLHSRVIPNQSLYDMILPYMSPRRRPLLTWSDADSRDDLRSLVVRGQSWPVVLGQNGTGKFPTLVATFYSADPYVRAPAASTATLVPSAATEAGRAYTEAYDKDFPAQPPFGSTQAVNNGTAPADWVGTIFTGSSGTVVNPVLTINEVDMTFDQNTGLTMTANQTLVVDTQARTVLLNGDPSTPRYNRVNYLDWTWDDLQLQPGSNLVRFDHSGTSTEAAFTIRWYDSWM